MFRYKTTDEEEEDDDKTRTILKEQGSLKENNRRNQSAFFIVPFPPKSILQWKYFIQIFLFLFFLQLSRFLFNFFHFLNALVFGNMRNFKGIRWLGALLEFSFYILYWMQTVCNKNYTKEVFWQHNNVLLLCLIHALYKPLAGEITSKANYEVFRISSGNNCFCRKD